MSAIRYALEDKVFVVTGGSRGIGFEIVKNLVDQGALVAFCGRKKENIEQAAQSLGTDPARILPHQAHIAKEDEVDGFFNAAMKAFGRVDALINNVGMNLVTGSVADTDFATWDKIISTNLHGTFLCSRKAAKIMKDQKKGKIVSISSIAARRASPAMGIYGIAKAGIEMLTRVLAAELAPFNIQVNAVAPSMVRTDFSKPFWSNKDIYDMVVKRIPMGRIAEPADVVHSVLFLSSEASDFITGQTLLVDGGASVI